MLNRPDRLLVRSDVAPATSPNAASLTDQFLATLRTPCVPQRQQRLLRRGCPLRRRRCARQRARALRSLRHFARARRPRCARQRARALHGLRRFARARRPRCARREWRRLHRGWRPGPPRQRQLPRASSATFMHEAPAPRVPLALMSTQTCRRNPRSARLLARHRRRAGSARGARRLRVSQCLASPMHPASRCAAVIPPSLARCGCPLVLTVGGRFSRTSAWETILGTSERRPRSADSQRAQWRIVRPLWRRRVSECTSSARRRISFQYTRIPSRLWSTMWNAGQQ